MKLTIILFLILSTAQLSSQDSLLCPGSFWTEDEGNLKMKEFSLEWDDLESWESRAQIIKQGIIEGLQLERMPTLTGDFNPTIRSTRIMDGYIVENIAIECFPGFYVTGNLYRPTEEQQTYAGILCPHGHWDDGRMREAMQIRCAALARMGAVVFAYDMIGYGDSQQVEHKIPYALLLQTYSSQRVLAYLLSRQDIDPDRIGMTGASGGGTQTFILAAIDERIRVSAPIVMVSSHFFGGCVCESGMPIHRSKAHQTNNVEIAAVSAPRPLLLISDGDDWTRNNPRVEYPYVAKVFGLYNAEHKVEHVHFPAARHDYGYAKRVVVYNFLAHHLELNSGALPFQDGYVEDFVTLLTTSELSVFNDDYPRPDNALIGYKEVLKSINILKE